MGGEGRWFELRTAAFVVSPGAFMHACVLFESDLDTVGGMPRRTRLPGISDSPLLQAVCKVPDFHFRAPPHPIKIVQADIRHMHPGKLGGWALPWPKLFVVCLTDQPSQSLIPVRFRSWWKYREAP